MIRRGALRTILTGAGLALFSSAAFAVDNSGVLTQITDRFNTIASTWAATILAYASALFWTLASISLVWTGTLLILRRADIQEFFAEFLKFTLTLGFYYWLLLHGPAIGKAIIDSFVRIGGNAMHAGISAPSGILDLGFQLAFKTYDAMSFDSPMVSIAGVALAVAILILLTLVAANLTVQFCAAWIVLYAGCILLGFGGSRWTSDIAIQYFKTVLGIGLSLMTMILLLGVGSSILDQYFSAMSGGIQLKELTVILVVVVILFLLVDKLPSLMAGIVSHGIGSSGIGRFGTGTAMAAGGVAVAAGGIAAHGAVSALSKAAQYSGASALLERIRAGQSRVVDDLGEIGHPGEKPTFTATGTER